MRQDRRTETARSTLNFGLIPLEVGAGTQDTANSPTRRRHRKKIWVQRGGRQFSRYPRTKRDPTYPLKKKKKLLEGRDRPMSLLKGGVLFSNLR